MKTPLLLVAMMLSLASFAQTAYTLTSYSSPYEELSNPIPVEFLDEEGPWDDPIFIIPFGFDFEIGGETFNSTTQFSSGAMMGFGNFLTPEIGEVSFFGLTDDIVDGSTIEGLDTSIISYQIVGDEGNRIAKIQYENVAFYEEVFGPEPAAENRMNFQLWFYELNSVMEVHYGNSTVTNPDLVFFGYMGPSTVLAINLDLDSETIEYGAAIIGDPVDPTLSTFTFIPDEEFQSALDTMPISGQVHRLAPANPDGLFNAKAPEFSIYPTIAQTNLWVKGETNARAKYRIIDITGKVVMTGNMQNQNAINVSNLNAGVYLFSIDGMNNAAKFIKQ